MERKGQQCILFKRIQNYKPRVGGRVVNNTACRNWGCKNLQIKSSYTYAPYVIRSILNNNNRRDKGTCFLSIHSGTLIGTKENKSKDKVTYTHEKDENSSRNNKDGTRRT